MENRAHKPSYILIDHIIEDINAYIHCLERLKILFLLLKWLIGEQIKIIDKTLHNEETILSW